MHRRNIYIKIIIIIIIIIIHNCTYGLILISQVIIYIVVEKLLSVDVVVIGCGPHHVAVLSRDGEMYSWGRGDGGRLGLGHEEDWYLFLYNKTCDTMLIHY